MKKLFGKVVALLAAATMTFGCSDMKKINRLPYPDTERGEVVDNYFGTEVADPYRWLEDDNSEATAAWVAAENAVTQDYLRQIPFRRASQVASQSINIEKNIRKDAELSM